MRTSALPSVSKFPSAIFGETGGRNRHFVNQSANTSVLQCDSLRDNTMNFTRTDKAQTFRADPETVREADILSLKEWANKLSAKEGARIAGMTPSGFKKVQAGEAALSFEKLMNSMRRDPELLAMIFSRCGGNLNMSPNQFAAIARAVNSIVRGDMGE